MYHESIESADRSIDSITQEEMLLGTSGSAESRKSTKLAVEKWELLLINSEFQNQAQHMAAKRWNGGMAKDRFH